MKLSDLVESGLVKDNHQIIVSQRIVGTIKSVRRGNWYQDHILDCLDREIYSIHYKTYCEGRWYVELMDVQED